MKYVVFSLFLFFSISFAFAQEVSELVSIFNNPVVIGGGTSTPTNPPPGVRLRVEGMLQTEKICDVEHCIDVTDLYNSVSGETSGRGIYGSGNSGRLAVFTGTHALSSSIIRENASGTAVGIAMTPSSYGDSNFATLSAAGFLSADGIYLNEHGIYADGVATLYHDSNHSTSSEFVLRNSENDVYGSLRSEYRDGIISFGLVDADRSWSYRVVKGNYIEMGISDQPYFKIGPKSIITGQYGTVTTAGGGKGGWEGYSINGRAAFVDNTDTKTTGIYDDVNNKWMFSATRGSYSSLYYDGVLKLRTESDGVSTVGKHRSEEYCDEEGENCFDASKVRVMDGYANLGEDSRGEKNQYYTSETLDKGPSEYTSSGEERDTCDGDISAKYQCEAKENRGCTDSFLERPNNYNSKIWYTAEVTCIAVRPLYLVD